MRLLLTTSFIVLLSGCASSSSSVSMMPPPDIKASRVFAGPNQFPPEHFAAYGIVAFPTRATIESTERYLAICGGYLAAIPSASSLEKRGIPAAQQMATVWPLQNSNLATSLNRIEQPNEDEECAKVVSSIDLITSKDAIQKARESVGGPDLDGRGPYLLAWSPSGMFGQPGAPVLVADLSNVTTIDQAKQFFIKWTNDIEKDPSLWNNGWNIETLRTKLRLWADRWGPGVLAFFGS